MNSSWKLITRFVFAATLSLSPGCTWGPASPPPEVRSATEPELSPIPNDAQTRAIALKQVGFALDPLKPIGTYGAGIVCTQFGELLWADARKGVLDPDYIGDHFKQIFYRELRSANYSVAGDPDSAFEKVRTQGAELLVAATVSNLEVAICWPEGGFGDFKIGYGWVLLTINWELYSEAQQTVLRRVITKGSDEATERTPVQDILDRAFARATRKFLADKDLLEYIRAQK